MKRKDANHKAIVDALRRVGGHWIDTTGDPSTGLDGIAVYRGVVHLCEIKDGSKPPSARKLTDREMTRKVEVEARGVKYNIIVSEEAMLKLIGAIR
jgi:hypothetical protein